MDPYQGYLTDAKALFIEKSETRIKTDQNWTDFLARLTPNQKQKLGKLMCFYNYTCKNGPVRSDFVFVAITSMIEDLMSAILYEDFYNWLTDARLEEFGSLEVAKSKYIESFGCNRKFQTFFLEYLLPVEQKFLLSSIKVNSKEITIEELAALLYRRRSFFVHEATLQPFNTGGNFSVLSDAIGGKALSITCSVSDITYIFEKGFVRFWENIS